MYFNADIEFMIDEYYCKNSHHYDASDGLRMHYFVRIKQGNARFAGEDFEFAFSAGDVFFTPCGCKYHSYWEGDEIVWDSIGFSLLPQNINYVLQPIESVPGMNEIIDKIMVRRESFDANTVALVYTLIGLLLPNMESNRSQTDKLIDKATEFMRSNISASIPTVAKYCCINESTLYAAFRSIGTTPVKTRLEIQLERAKTLLSTTDLSVNSISKQCGFNSTSYFYKVFKKIKGCYPSELRYFS